MTSIEARSCDHKKIYRMLLGNSAAAEWTATAKLPPGKNGEFPYFEVLQRSPGRSCLPKDAEVVICRLARR